MGMLVFLVLSNPKQLNFKHQCGESWNFTVTLRAISILIRDVDTPMVTLAHGTERNLEACDKFVYTESLGDSSLPAVIEHLA